jgi:hypothetical protein
MARRTPLTNPDRAIQILKEDGGVILTGFSSVSNVEKVNAEATPYIDAIVEDVTHPIATRSQITQDVKVDKTLTAFITRPRTRDNPLHPALRALRHSSRDLAATTRPAENHQSFPAHGLETIQFQGWRGVCH